MASLLLMANLLPVSPALATENSQLLTDSKTASLQAIENQSYRELIVKFKAGTTEEEKKRVFREANVRELDYIDNGDISLVKVLDEDGLKELAKLLYRNPSVIFAEPNYKVKSSFVPTDPYFKKQWHTSKIQMPKAWDFEKGAASVTVAVIDGGVETDHPDLVGKIVSPINLVADTTIVDKDPHGTHVAGIIAASANKIGTLGIAPGVKIMPIDVFQGEFAEVFDIVEGIYYAADHGAKVINLSLGLDEPSEALDVATNYAHSKGAVVVAAAGNSDTSTLTYPAASPHVIGVSATDHADEITSFSNYGEYIDLAAPGLLIYSTYPGGTYRYLSGTSMAAPVVSGVAALVLSKNSFLTPIQVEEILKKSALDLGDKGWDEFYGFGRVDALRSLENTPLAVTDIQSTSNIFPVTGTSRTAFSFITPNDTTVTVYIQDSKGYTVKRLVTGRKWAGGRFSIVWDGKLDNGYFATTGTYKVIARVAGASGSVTKIRHQQVIDRIQPAITLPNASVSFSSTTGAKVSIPYELNKAAKVTINIQDTKGNVVKTFYNNLSMSAGKRTLNWDGKDLMGKMVPNGAYKLTFTVTDNNKSKKITQATIIVDGKNI